MKNLKLNVEGQKNRSFQYQQKCCLFICKFMPKKGKQTNKE